MRICGHEELLDQCLEVGDIEVAGVVYLEVDADVAVDRFADAGTVARALLEVDLVPIVSLDEDANYGYQYSRAGDRVKTSVKVHIEHYRSYAAQDPFLAPTLRMAKRWRHWHELDGVQSFHLELMVTFLVSRDGPAPSLEESLRRLFRLVISDLSDGLAFDGANTGAFTGPVVIVDPANAANNVAARMEPRERDEFVEAARTAYETITWAQGLPGKGETVAAWKEILGEGFAID